MPLKKCKQIKHCLKDKKNVVVNIKETDRLPATPAAAPPDTKSLFSLIKKQFKVISFLIERKMLTTLDCLI